MQENYRLFGAYRLFLAWLVLTSHANAYLPGWVGQLALGNIGVFSFFVLSGFVIVEACDRFYRGAPHRFFLNRFLRIYPTYWGACVLAVAVYLALGHQDLSGSLVQVVANLSIVYSPPGVFMWISIVWAVAIELRFYLIAGLVMGLAQRKPGIAVPVLGAAGCTALLGYLARKFCVRPGMSSPYGTCLLKSPRAKFSSSWACPGAANRRWCVVSRGLLTPPPER